MHTIKHVFEKIIDIETLRNASRFACRTRKDKNEVEEFLENKENNLLRLRQSLIDGTYRSSRYKMFTIHEKGKERRIADLPLYPDRILHWAICLACESETNKKLIDQTYASVPGRGYHDAVKKVYRYIRSDDKIRYVLVFDIRKFFQSISTDILKRRLSKTYRDERFLQLMFQLIDEYPESGIPIGNRYSPMLANLYLSKMDHALKEKYHVHYYVRFMDDCCILGYSKEWLHKILGIIKEQLHDIGLELKTNCQIFPLDSRGVHFLGYDIYSDHIRLRKETKKRMIDGLRDIRERQNDGDALTEHDKGVIASYNGVLMNCNGRRLYKKYIQPLLDQNLI